jgi:hypothetical protein
VTGASKPSIDDSRPLHLVRRLPTWRCLPGPLSVWERTLAVVLAVATVFEAAILARMLHLSHPLIVALVMAASILPVFSLRAALRAPVLRIEGGALVLRVRDGAPGTSVAASFPIDDLDLDGAAVVNLDARPDLAPADEGAQGPQPECCSPRDLRRLANGRSAHVFAPRRGVVLYLPTLAGDALLVSLRRPRDLLAALGA